MPSRPETMWRTVPPAPDEAQCAFRFVTLCLGELRVVFVLLFFKFGYRYMRIWTLVNRRGIAYFFMKAVMYIELNNIELNNWSNRWSILTNFQMGILKFKVASVISRNIRKLKKNYQKNLIHFLKKYYKCSQFGRVVERKGSITKHSFLKFAFHVTEDFLLPNAVCIWLIVNCVLIIAWK